MRFSAPTVVDHLRRMYSVFTTLKRIQNATPTNRVHVRNGFVCLEPCKQRTCQANNLRGCIRRVALRFSTQAILQAKAPRILLRRGPCAVPILCAGGAVTEESRAPRKPRGEEVEDVLDCQSI